MDDHISALRYHDVVCIGADLNMEVFDANQQDERFVHLQESSVEPRSVHLAPAGADMD